MQCTQINCNKKETEITNCETREANEVNIKSRLYYCSAKQTYNRKNEIVSTITVSNTNNNVI